MADEQDNVVRLNTGEHVEGGAEGLIVVAAFNVGTGRSDPDETGKRIPCVAVSIVPANMDKTVMLILPENTVVDFITQLMDAKGKMIRENPRRG